MKSIPQNYDDLRSKQSATPQTKKDMLEIIKKLFVGKKKFLTIPIVVLVGLFFLPITILLLIGWFIYAKIQNKKIKIVGLSIIGLFILVFGWAYASAILNPTPPKPATKVERETVETKTLPSPSPTSKPENLVKVTRVIDGDTIEIEGGKRVRLIGIDSPETDMCYNKEATNKAKELLENQEVTLEKDVSETDRYGRLLRYIWKGDVLINEQIAHEGYAASSSYPPDVKYQERIVAAQKEARDGGKGLWGAACAATPTPTPKVIATPTAIPKVITTPTPTPLSTSTTQTSCKYSCSAPDRDCTSDFSTHSEAQAFFNCCGFTATNDPMKLDSVGVGDGIACESLP